MARSKTNYGCKMWRAIITQSLVSFDPLPYDTTTNNTLFSVVDLPGNLCALGGGVGGGVSGTAFGERYESGSCLLTKLETDTGTGKTGIVGGIYVGSMEMVAAGGDKAEMQDNEGRRREAEILR